MDDSFIKLISILIIAILGIANILKRNPIKDWKENIKMDLDILDKLPENHPERKLIEAHVDISISVVYSQDIKPWYSWVYKENKPIYLLFIFLLSLIVAIVWV